MTSSILAYAFLKASFGKEVNDPIDALQPLVKRALMDQPNSKVDQANIQRRIKKLFGITVPLNVIRFTFPRLKQEGAVRLVNSIYEVTNSPSALQEIRNLEQVSRDQYLRVCDAVDFYLSESSINKFSSDEVIEKWLDESAFSFLGTKTPVFGGGLEDKEINRVILLAMRDESRGDKFLDDIADIALGDSIFRAIQSITEMDTSESVATRFAFKSRMDGVHVFFDTPLLFRILGYANDELVVGARELVSLCEQTGAKLCVFEHSVREFVRSVRGFVSQFGSPDSKKNDLMHYVKDNKIDPGDLVSALATIQDKIEELGFEVINKPLPNESSDLSETELEDQLRVDLHTQRDDARIADVESLSSIYYIRNGEPFRYLEKTPAILVTSTKALMDSSVRYFRKQFKGKSPENRVQICMTDVVFSARLWTKLPTSMSKIQRSQVVSHVLSNVAPRKEQREAFIRHLRNSVKDERMSEKQAASVELSQFVDEALAMELTSHAQAISEKEYVSVVRRINAMNRKRFDRMVNEGVAEVESAYLQQISELENKLETLKSEVGEPQKFSKDSLEIERVKSDIDTIKRSRAGLEAKIERAVKKASSLVICVIIFSFALLIFQFSPLQEILKNSSFAQEFVFFQHFSFVLNLLVSIAFVFLGWWGLSAAQVQKKIVKFSVDRIIRFLFGSGTSNNR